MTERDHFTNGRCLTFGTGLTLLGTAFGAQVSGWSHWITMGIGYGVGIILMLIAAVSITKSYFPKQSENNAVALPEQGQRMTPGIPTLSSLLGQNPDITFDAKKFFALAYYSPITAEFEKNIKIIAQEQSHGDKEGFYARFIGVGLAAIHYDRTWLLIFGSQLKAMEEMNSRGLIPISDLKKHYDKAVVEYPHIYANYSFEQWLAFIKGQMMIAAYPSQMVELSWMGKDFLRYIAHTARDINAKKN